GASPGVESGAEAGTGAETDTGRAVGEPAAGRDGERAVPSCPPEPPFTILTFSSRSVISSSAIPDSSTRSISFFNLRKSRLPSFRSGHERPFPRGFGALGNDSETRSQFGCKVNCSANSYARLPSLQIVPSMSRLVPSMITILLGIRERGPNARLGLDIKEVWGRCQK